MLRTFNIKLKINIKIIFIFIAKKTIYNRYKNTRFVDYVGENPFLLMLALYTWFRGKIISPNHI